MPGIAPSCVGDAAICKITDLTRAIDRKIYNTSTVLKSTKNPKLNLSGSRSFGTTPVNDIKVRYNLSDTMSVIGSWEVREYENVTDAQTQNNNENSSILGLDLEYRVPFR